MVSRNKPDLGWIIKLIAVGNLKFLEDFCIDSHPLTLISLNAIHYIIFIDYTRQFKDRMEGRVITKTCLYNFDPLEPHFYIEKLGFTGVYIIFLIFAQNIDCGYLLEPPHPQSMF